MPLTARAVRRDGEGDIDRFRSIALYSQLKLGELFGDPSSRDGFGDRRPTVAETAVCAHILQELAMVKLHPQLGAAEAGPSTTRSTSSSSAPSRRCCASHAAATSRGGAPGGGG